MSVVVGHSYNSASMIILFYEFHFIDNACILKIKILAMCSIVLILFKINL